MSVLEAIIACVGYQFFRLSFHAEVRFPKLIKTIFLCIGLVMIAYGAYLGKLILPDYRIYVEGALIVLATLLVLPMVEPTHAGIEFLASGSNKKTTLYTWDSLLVTGLFVIYVLYALLQ